MAKSKKKSANEAQVAAKKTVKATVSKRNQTSEAAPSEQLLFGRENYKFMLIGIGLIALGMILMMGGGMPSDDIWDESIIYSPVRTVISPILILAGLALQFVAIFRKA